MYLLEIEIRIGITGNKIVGVENVLDVLVDEVVEGDQVLLHQTTHLEHFPTIFSINRMIS